MVSLLTGKTIQSIENLLYNNLNLDKSLKITQKQKHINSQTLDKVKKIIK